MTESGGKTKETMIISCGGIATSQLQFKNIRIFLIKGSSMTKKGKNFVIGYEKSLRIKKNSQL